MKTPVKSILLAAAGALLGLIADYIGDLQMKEAVNQAVDERFAMLESPTDEEEEDGE